MVVVRTRILIGGLLALTASGCLTPMPDAVTSLVAATATAVAANNAGGDVYLSIDTAWEQDPSTFTHHGTCQVDAGSATRTVTCTIRIPEGQLFYSNTKFTFGTGNPSLCHRVQFFPAVYQKSNSAVYTSAFSPLGGTIDCSTSSLIDIPGIPGVPALGSNLNCFGGPARALYQNWPAPLGKYLSTAVGATNEGSETIDASNTLSTRNYPVAIDGNYLTNLAVANMIDTPTANLQSPLGLDTYYAQPFNAVSNPYGATYGSMRPYRARCVDTHEQIQAEVVVNIADEDLDTGEAPGAPLTDQFWDFMQTL